MCCDMGLVHPPGILHNIINSLCCGITAGLSCMQPVFYSPFFDLIFISIFINELPCSAYSVKAVFLTTIGILVPYSTSVPYCAYLPTSAWEPKVWVQALGPLSPAPTSPCQTSTPQNPISCRLLKLIELKFNRQGEAEK